MKKINMEILKYFSGLMSEKENLLFEKKLDESGETKKEYDFVVGYLENISTVKDIELDERYFSSLLPRMREDVAKTKHSHVKKLVYYTVPITVLFLIGIFFFSGSPIQETNQPQSLTEVIADNLNDEEVAERYIDYSYIQSVALSNNDVDVSFPDEIKIPKDMVNDYTLWSNGTILLDSYSNDELEAVYKTLNTLTL